MPQPPAPPVNKKKRQRLIIIGAAGAALLLLLYIRSRSSSANATSSTDAQTAAANAAAQQAAIDQQNASSLGATPSTFADNGSNAAQLDSDVTSSLQGVTDALTQLKGSLPSAVAAPAATLAPTATPAVTVNVNGQPAGTSPTSTRTTPASAPRMSTNVPRGLIAAPFGHNKPAAPKGYTAVGLGSGNWGFKPVPTKSTQSKNKKK